MNFSTSLFRQVRLVFTLTFAAAVAGALCWGLMPRQEDPDLPARNGMIVVPFPGANADVLEEQVIEPLETQLEEINDIQHVTSTARNNVAIVSVQMRDDLYETDAAWDDVEDALTKATRRFPEGTLPAETNWKLNETSSVVFAVTGSEDPIVLLRAAEELEERLRVAPGVSKVELVGDPVEQITVQLDPHAAETFGVRAPMLVAALSSRSQTTPSGSIRVRGRQVILDAGSRLRNLQELRETPIFLPATQTSVPLDTIAHIGLVPRTPVRDAMHFNGQRAIAVTVTPKKEIDLIKFGEHVQHVAQEATLSLAPLKVHTVAFQPRRVESRLADLGESLLLGIGVVALVLILTMGFRLGFTVALVVPLVALSSLALYAAFGGVLQQISIAALVLSLGLLVDNAIVVAERIQGRIDQGETPRDAATSSVRELALPLLAATGTTMASFLPQMLARGTSGDFTRSIPVVVMLTLAVSFVFAVLVTPTLAALLFRPSKTKASTQNPLQTHLHNTLSLPTRHPWKTVLASLSLVVVAGLLAPMIKKQFFPGGDRNQLVYELNLPKGTHLDETQRAALLLEGSLLQQPGVSNVSTFVGRGVPPFYYNLPRKPQVPHVAQLLVNTNTSKDVDPLITWGRTFAKSQLHNVTFVAKKLEQGPPVAAPIEFRLYAPNDAAHALWVEEVLNIVRADPDTVDARHDMDLGTPTLNVRVYDAIAAQKGLDRQDIARGLFQRTWGLPAGDLWRGEDRLPIVVRSPEGEATSVETLLSSVVSSQRGMASLETVSSVGLQLRPSEITRRDGRRVVRVLAELQPGASFATVLARLTPQLDARAKGTGVRYEVGGAAEGSGDANRSLLVAAPLGAVVLLLILLAQFRSFRKVGIVLLTVPLAATGVVPGLLIANQPFGFTSLLGVFALVGIVVNNAILLIDFIDTERDRGTPLDDALSNAVALRMRPILLTTVTTIVGLVPLLFSSSTLWPPLASSLISGLIASTFLTLFVVPAAYKLAFDTWLPRRLAASTLVFGLVCITAPSFASAQPNSKSETFSLQEAMDRAAVEHPDVRTSLYTQKASSHEVDRTQSAAWLPTLSVQASKTLRDDERGILTPFGKIIQQQTSERLAAVRIRQPLLDLGTQVDRVHAARERNRAETLATEITRRSARLETANAWLDVRDLDAQRLSLRKRLDALDTQHARVVSLVELERALRSDLLRIDVQRDEIRRNVRQLDSQRLVALRSLARLLNTAHADVSKAPVSLPKHLHNKRATQPEVARVERQGQSLDAERAALRKDALPTIALTGEWLWTPDIGLDPESVFQATAVLSWTPFAGAQRILSARSLEARRSALRTQRRDIETRLDLALLQHKTSFEIARDDVQVQTKALAQTQEVVRILRLQYEAGRATLTDLLQAEAQYAQAQTRRDLARHRVIRAWLAAQHAAGLPIRLPNEP